VSDIAGDHLAVDVLAGEEDAAGGSEEVVALGCRIEEGLDVLVGVDLGVEVDEVPVLIAHFQTSMFAGIYHEEFFE